MNYESITIPSMSVAGDSLYLYVDESTTSIYMELQGHEGSNGAYFNREQQMMLRDWLNKVLP